MLVHTGGLDPPRSQVLAVHARRRGGAGGAEDQSGGGERVRMLHPQRWLRVLPDEPTAMLREYSVI